MNDNQGLCLTHFNPKKVVRHICCDCNSMVGKSYAALRYIEKGSVTFTMAGNKVTAREGDFLFIPSGTRYYAVWQGDPEVVFYSIDFNFTKINGLSVDNNFAFDVISLPCTNGKNPIKCIFNQHGEGGEIDKISAISEFYKLFATVLPMLRPAENDTVPKSILLAIDFIQQNYKRDFSGKEIAKACFLSESRLYHLFSEVMRCSPITYKNRLKINDAINMLTQTDLSIEEIAAELNFNSAVYFRKVFKSVTGANPFEYRKKEYEIMQRIKKIPR